MSAHTRTTRDNKLYLRYIKLDKVALLLADPPPGNSTTDTDTPSLITGQPNLYLYGHY